LDGKRILLQAPDNSGSFFHDYKQQFSIVLLALVDANYCFRYVDVGANGRQSDAGIFGRSSISTALKENSLNIPGCQVMPGSNTLMPLVVVGDDAFPLQTNLIKPYPNRLYDDKESRIFNYRLSRARRVVENAFGILAHRWRVLLSRMLLCPEKAEKVVLVACCLHNFLRRQNEDYQVLADSEDANTHLVTPGPWRVEDEDQVNWMSVGQQGSKGYSGRAKEIRDNFRAYFNGVGQVPWQNGMI
jgi:DDE superfamily endonuclease